MSDHASTQFRFGGCQDASHMRLALTPFPQLKHDPDTHLISNMSKLGHRPAVHPYSWFGTAVVLQGVAGYLKEMSFKGIFLNKKQKLNC
jgi:hypothetical protein